MDPSSTSGGKYVGGRLMGPSGVCGKYVGLAKWRGGL